MNLKYILHLLLILCLCNSCIPIRSIFLARPDNRDSRRFSSNHINASTDCFQFKTSKQEKKIRVNNWTSDLPEFEDLNSLCLNHAVRELLVIQNDSLIFNYRNYDSNLNMKHPSYSIAKSIVSCLVGIAIDEGSIKDENDRVTRWLPELKKNSFSDSLRIHHLLNHTSGIRYSVSGDARIYYGENSAVEIKKLQFEHAPGSKQKYLNINTQLLGILLSRAVGMTLSEYAEIKLWQPLEMCENATWSSGRNNMEKAFCCITASAQDYAKFGRLYLNKGKWNGKTIFSEEWFDKSIRRDSTNGSSFNFNYSWHIGLKKYEDFMAIGLYKQHIYIYPEKNIIIVLLNDREKKLIAERVNWWNVFRQIGDQL